MRCSLHPHGTASVLLHMSLCAFMDLWKWIVYNTKKCDVHLFTKSVFLRHFGSNYTCVCIDRSLSAFGDCDFFTFSCLHSCLRTVRLFWTCKLTAISSPVSNRWTSGHWLILLQGNSNVIKPPLILKSSNLQLRSATCFSTPSIPGRFARFILLSNSKFSRVFHPI